MFCGEETVRFQCPVPESGLTTAEIQELLSLFQVEDAVSPNSGSQGSNHTDNSVDMERKRRRMISNRESARRSRWRKKRHLENVTDEVKQLKLRNRELKNRLGQVMNQCDVVRKHNERLRSQSVALWARLSGLYSILTAMQSC